MPYRNVLISAKQHGAPVPTKPALCSLLPLCLLSLALCLAAVAGLPACLPCPPACRCLRWDSSCTVNCSKAGFQQAPETMDLPPNTSVLDLSYNGINSIDENLLDNLTSLEKLYLQGNNISILFKEIFAGRRCLSDIDISNNQISTLEDGIFADLFNLTKINLSFNEFVCDCNLSWLPTWMNEEEANGVIIVDSEFIKCAKPSKLKDVSVLNVNFSSLLYGSEFAACSPDRQSLVNLSLMSNWISSTENCTALCFIEGERYAALDNESHCLCGSELASDSDSICIAGEIDREFIQVCGCTIIEQAFEVTVANFADLRTFSLFEAARLTVKTLVNISTFQWDFGDLSPPFNTTSQTVFHKYSLPGTYLVSVAFCVGSKPTSLHVEINVAIPPGRLELHCPPVVQTNKSIDAEIQNWNTNSVIASWSVTTSNNDTIKDAPFCPLGGYQCNNHCYRLVTNSSSWQMARHFCQSDSDGDLAIVKSPEIQNFIANITGCEHSVWIGLSDTAGAGTLQWVDGSTLEIFQEWLPRQHNTLLSNTCVLMGANLAGEWRTDLCTTKRNFVCEYKAGEKIPGANYYLLGSPAFSTHLPVKNITVNYSSSTPSGLVELMVFPGLWFNHKGFVSVLELATQDLNHTIQVKFKIYRPRCAGKDMHLVTPDNEEVCSSFAFCLPRTPSNITHGCNSDTKWCSLAETCLPLKRPCGTDVFIKCPNLLPPHFSESHPLYDLVKEVPCTVPAESSTHYVLLLRNERIEVQSNDIIAIQHDGKPGSFLQCQQNDSSPWQQSYYSVVYSGESRGLWINLTDTNWTDGAVCNLRVLYTHRQEINASSPLLQNGQQLPGVYTYQAMVESGPFYSNASCNVQVMAPITDFSVIYPLKQNGVFYVPRNRPVIIVKVKSSEKTLTSWSGSNQNFSCEVTCPSELSSNCEKDDNTCFSRILLTVKDCNLTSIVITAKNKVSSVNKTLAVRAEDPIKGLTILPDPSIRVLSNSLVTYTARVSSGTNIMFKWTVDDKASFIYYNQVYKVIYRTEAVYKLSLIASNHVCNQKIICNVTVDRRNPLTEFNVSAVPAILVRGFSYTFAASVKVDAAVNATFRWGFGDGSYDQVYQFTCPYNLSLSVPQLTAKQAMLQQNVTHIYQKPGEYNLTVSVSDKYDNASQLVPLSVYSYLSNLSINVSSEVLSTGKPAEFEAILLPSPRGVTYSWSFGDNSTELAGDLRRVTHTFGRADRYKVTVQASNVISMISTHRWLEVLDEISGLHIADNSPTELYAPTIVHASAQTGSRPLWVFDMGDGSAPTATSSSVMNHTYSEVGNYTVAVTARNAVSAANATRVVRVFVLHVSRVRPAGCVRQLLDVNFTAYTPGDSAGYVFFWDFGDGSPNQTVPGEPSASHNYTRSGVFPLYLVVSSSVNQVNYYSNVCVQPVISHVTISPSRSFLAARQEGTWRVDVRPDGHYTYLWELEPQLHGREVNLSFAEPGLHWVNVTVFNNVSWGDASASVQIQEALTVLRIVVHGARSLADLVVHRPYTFLAESDGTQVRYSWDFGDGTNGTGNNVSHSYAAAGPFRVRLLASNAVSHGLKEEPVTVKTPLRRLQLTANATVAPVNLSVGFEASLQEGDFARYSWSFCRCCEATEGPANVSHAFTRAGIFNVTVRVENGVSLEQASIQIHVLEEIRGLEMSLGHLVEGCCLAVNQTLWFQAASRFGTEVSYNWTVLWEDVVLLSANTTSSQIYLLEAGSYAIVLHASNLLGTVSVNRSVTVLEPVDIVSLWASPEPVAVNKSTSITLIMGSGTEVTYFWALDGIATVSTNLSFISYSFQNPGVKRVNVTASNKLSSQSVTLLIRVQEPVADVTITAGTSANQQYAATNTTVFFQGSTSSGSNISWLWTLPFTVEQQFGQEMNKSFPLPGVYNISLNASNDVSWETASMNFTVQDKIQGLQLEASKWAVAPGQDVIFSVKLSSGTDARFWLSVDNFTMLLNSTNYRYLFSHLGTYEITLKAENQVSCEHTSIEIHVQEPVADLRLVNCNEQAIPAGVMKNFSAAVSSGFQVMYQWHFVLGDYSDIITGQNVSYTPKVQGRLSIFLKAFNNVSGEDITAGILVQNQILKARLTVMPSITAVNETVHLSLAVTPSFSQATFTWKFGDGSQINFANTSVVSHSYLRPGNYLVEVNASNLVSFYVAQATVTILLLKCDPPKVSMILSETMQRSQRNYLEADIDLRGCTEYQVEYLWEIYKTSSCLTLQGVKQVQLPNVDLKRPRLLLPNLVLDIGRYCIVFTISFKGTSYVKITHSSIMVIPSALVPVIDGGTYRSWSTKQDLVMDGTKSYDPDQPADSQTPLNYEWLCTYSCLELSGCYISGMGSVFSIFREELKRNTTYTCSLRVSKPGREPQSVKQYISVKGGSSPLVSLECVSCKAQEVYGVSKSSYISLSGSCSNCESSPQYVWKVENSKKQLLTLDNATTSTGSTGMNLVMRHGVLEDGDGYTFSLNVTDPLMENVGFASIYIPPIHLPSGGDCVIFPTENICALTTSVTFTCTGWETTGIPLVYSFILTRCGVGGTHCDEFYVYKGSRSEYSAVLPPGFSSNQFIAYIAVTVQNQQGASVIALNRSVVINITNTPEGFQSFTDWMKLETETKLQELLKQGDPQPTVEYALALVTVLNEYERSKVFEKVWTNDTISRINIRSNITLALTSLEVSTVDDIQQISAALAQCTVISKELICSKCQNQTLFALDNMIAVLQKETGQGKMTPTSIGDNILVTVGGLIDMTNQLVPVMNKVTRPSMYKPELVATKAYDLSMKLMQILMGTRVLNEEPLSVSGARMWAQGKRADPGHLLCFANKSGCQFSIPPSFNSIFSNLSDVTQVMFLVDSNPFPYGYIKNYTISSKVASIEFKTDNGSQIPIESLGSEKAITVSVSTNSAIRNVTVNTTVIAARRSITVNVTSGNLNEKAGLHIQVTYTVLNDSGAVIANEAEPFILVLLHNSTNPNEQNFKARKKIYLESVKGSDHKLYTFFLSPDTDDTTKNYYLNITNFYTSSSIQVAVGVYTSLCQYFNMTAMSWKTDGILPLEDTTPDMAVCLTQHLTAFGASLFVPPNSVVFINPPSPVIKNYIVLLTCGICFVIYAVSAVIVRKLDLIDINQVGIIPLCGKDGFYKYEILVKTGWGRGSGTSSHVGISLYGREDKSGYRHLENEDAFHRNSVDLFQIATDNSLGNIWKIRVWHDNKGLTPSWYLQHVIIKDLQTNNSYYFLVNDWLAVDNEKNEGLVEKEVLAATEAKLKDFSRIFTGEIQRGFSEGHIWLSIWNRPPRSCFTRVQRVTCCLVLIFLFFCASAVWYGMISDGSKSDVPVSTLVPLSGESVAAGIVSSIIIYPLYLIIVLLFRKARSRVAMHDPGQHESNVLELDDYIDSSTAGSSFLTFADNVEEDYKEKLKSDIITSSLPNWPAYDSMMNWPDLLNDQPMIGSNNSKLRRGRGTRHLGIETQLSSDDEPLSLGFDQVRNKYFSTSDERLIQRINIDETNEVSTSYDSGRVSLDAESHLISNLTEIIDGSKQPRAEAPILDQTNDNGQIIRPSQGIARSSTTRRIAFTDPPQQCLFPFWCSYTAHVLCLLLFSGCLIVSIWIGVNFTSRIALMWLISGIFSVLSSFFLLEPLKVLTEALYFTVVAKRIHPDEDDNLVAKPRVEQTLEKIGKVRPPQGYGLLQAKEEARKVQILHRMLKNFIIYMLFLLVVLLINYGDSFRDAQGRLLHSSIRQSLLGPSKGVEFQKIKRSGELWKWMAEVLLPYLYNNRSRTLLGCPRIRQIRSKINNVQCLQQPSSLPIITQCLQDPGLHDNRDHEAGWKSPVTNLSDTWSYSSPDLPGVWYWGQNAVYDSGGYIQKLGRTRDQSNYTLWNLQERNWLDVRTRAIFIEFTQYFQNVDLYSVVTLLLEFPFSGGVSTSIDIKPFSLLQLSTGVDFLLIMMIFLMLFVLYFTVTELVLISRRGKSYFLQFWNYLHWCIIILSICCVVLHLKCARIGDKQWALYRSSPNSFTNFYEMAYLSYVFTSVTATLLFLLTIKAARQLRFIRKWSIFGKTLCNSAKELMVIGATLVGLALVYAQIGYLVFSANLDDFKTFGGSILSLFAVIEKGVCFKQCLFAYPNLCYVYYTSYITIEVWIVLRLFAVVLIQNYKTMKLEMYRPAVEPQDYELVELFVKRLKMWIGISKEKEFRHKVKFEGMVSLPSQSSRDSKSTDLHTASTISDISSSSTSSVSIPVDTFPLVSPNKVTQIEINIHRLVPLFETLLEQFDRVNMATEDVYQIECKLRNVQDRMHQKKINKKAEELFAAYSRIKVRRQGDDLHSSLWNSRNNTRTSNTNGTQDGQQPGNIPLAEDSTKQGLRRKGPHPPRRKSKTSDKKWQHRASDDQTPQSSE